MGSGQGESGQDLSWLRQYYTPEKTDTLWTDTRVGSPAAVPGAAAAGFDLTPISSDKYEVVGHIGSGGMKVVRMVRDKDTTRAVAMATIRGELENQEMAARFVREARITAALEHPNIVPVHDLGTDAVGRPYFTMKMLEGESLQAILKKLDEGDEGYIGRYGLGPLLQMFQKVCNAIAFAHSRGVIHLDLKPANIHVSKFGEVLVLDWGLAKQVGDRETSTSGGVPETPAGSLGDLTLPGAVKGTPGFMAPEQARGENSRKDKRTDVYALGAILYALLTLKAPPSSDTAEKVLADTVAGNIVPPRRRAPGRRIPAALEAVAMKALSVDPQKRYESVEALSRDVDAFVGGYATSAQDVGIVTLLWLLIKRHKVRFALSALVLFLVAAIAAVSMVRIRASERTAVEALNKYRAEQEENRRLAIDAAPQVVKRAERYMRELRIEEALRELDVAVTLDSSLASAWMDRGLLLFSRQDFAGARESFRHIPAAQKPAPPPDRRKEVALGGQSRGKGDKRGSEPESVAEKFLLMTGGGARQLNAGEFLAFASNLVQVSSRSSSEVRMATAFSAFSAWNRAHGAGGPAYDQARDFARMLNPKAENLVVELTGQDDGFKAVVHGGRGLSNIAFLAGLRIVWLDIAGTGVSDLAVVHGAPLAYLDISGTGVRDISPVADAPLKELRMEGCKGVEATHLARLTQLERVIVSKDAVDSRCEAWLKGRRGLEVVYR
jgi:serine/threonine protein kinase